MKTIDFSVRLRQIRDSLGMGQTEFAQKLDIPRTSLINYEKGISTPSLELATVLRKKYNVDADWFLTGEGTPFIKQDTGTVLPGAGIGTGAGAGLVSSGRAGIAAGTVGIGALAGFVPLEEGSIAAAKEVSRSKNDKLSFSDYAPQNQEAEETALLGPTTYLVDGEVSLFKFSHGKPAAVPAHDADPNALVMLPIYSQRAAADPGQPPIQMAEIEAYMPVIYELLGGAHPRNCGIVRVVGDSMTDMTLFSGDLVIFDRSQIEGDGVYVISIMGDVRVKRIEYRTFEKKIIIRSENQKRYPDPEIISYEQAQEMLMIHGKVISWVHRHPY